MRSSRRLVVDLQACQTEGSALRGVGRYSRNLFDGLLESAHDCDVRALLSDELPHDVTLDGIPRSHITRVRGLPRWQIDRAAPGNAYDTLDSIALDALLAPLDADIVHVSNVFEGLAERVPLPGTGAAPGQIVSATLHDLIPLIYQDHYLREPHVRHWYMRRLGWVRRADLLLANSEATRQDAIALLGMQPHQVVTVHGGVDAAFRPSERGPDEALKRKYGIRWRFVLYTGGDDFRKNLKGAIAGYAAVPAPQRRDCQFVVVCAMPDEGREACLRFAREVGLSPSDLLMAGFVPDADLVGLYQSCDAYVFPSLYEGLGLPVLEAMACGAPVIGANNSSIRELIEREDAQFDASKPESIAAVLARVLTDSRFAGSLRRWGPQRAAQFTWREAGRRGMEAFAEAHARSAGAGISAAAGGWLPRSRMAVLTPLPPCNSGIADYNAQFLPFLSKYFEIDLFVDGYEVSDAGLLGNHRILPTAQFDGLAEQYAVILYEFGNSEFHDHMIELLERHPGVVGLHDGYLSGLMGYRDFNRGQHGSYVREMLEAHGPLARRYHAPAQEDADPVEHSMAALPCNRRVLQAAIGVISHTPFNLGLVAEFDPRGLAAPHRVIPQMFPLPQLTAGDREAARAALGIAADELIIATFGHIVWTKAGDQLVRAFVESRASQDARVRLVFAGELESNDFGKGLQRQITGTALAGRIRITGRLTAADYARWLRAVDIAVQLRIASRGGTSRAVLDCLGHGLPVIVNNDASFRDYAEDVVVKLPARPTDGEIAARFDALVRSSALRRSYAEAGRAHVKQQHDPAACAAQYAAALHEFSGRWRRRQAAHHADRMAPVLATSHQPVADTQLALDWLESVTPPAFRRQRILLDGGEVFDGPLAALRPDLAGLAQALYCSGRPGHEPLLIERPPAGPRLASAWLQSLGLLVPGELDRAEPAGVTVDDNDIWVALIGARPTVGALRALEEARLAGAVTCVALLEPLAADPAEQASLCAALALSNLVLAASSADAQRLQALADATTMTRPPRTAVWHWREGQDADTAPVGAAGLLSLLIGNDAESTASPSSEHA